MGRVCDDERQAQRMRPCRVALAYPLWKGLGAMALRRQWTYRRGSVGSARGS